MFTVPHPRDDWDVQLLVTCLPARAVGQDRTTNIVAKFDGLTAHCDKQLLWWDFMSQLLSREENIVDYNPVCMCIDDAFTAIANWTRQISKFTILILWERYSLEKYLMQEEAFILIFINIWSQIWNIQRAIAFSHLILSWAWSMTGWCWVECIIGLR